jgi:hypothetical protein
MISFNHYITHLSFILNQNIPFFTFKEKFVFDFSEEERDKENEKIDFNLR